MSAPRVAYAIVSTPRCGSEFLCEALASTGVAGYPREHLRSHTERLRFHWQLDATTYLRAVMARRFTPNGVFGTKLISHFLFSHLTWSRDLERTLAEFRFVRLLRRDVVGQAISAAIASQTGTYHVRNAVQQERYEARLRGVSTTDGMLQLIAEIQTAFAEQERDLDELFRRIHASPLVIHYEELIDDPVPHVSAILSFLGVATPIDSICVRVRKTESLLSHVVRERYLEWIGGDT